MKIGFGLWALGALGSLGFRQNGRLRVALLGIGNPQFNLQSTIFTEGPHSAIANRHSAI
jgi:hypothetical protein